MNFSRAEGAALLLTAGLLTFFAVHALSGGQGPGYTVTGAHPAREAAASVREVYVPDTLLDLNTASVQDLLTLPGVGQAKAQAIWDHRRANGPFHTPQDLTRVPGIGQSVYEKLAPYVTASAP